MDRGWAVWRLALAAACIWTPSALAGSPAGGPPLVQEVPAAQEPVDTPTPVVEPEATAPAAHHRLFAPYVVRLHDPFAPGPLLAQAEGFVSRLPGSARSACAPATHMLLSRPEGTAGAVPVALAYRATSNPDANLDFYFGRLVVASGTSQLAPAPCRHLSWQLLAVTAVVEREVPPGALAQPRARAGSGDTHACLGRPRPSAR